ncbi:TonB-dependent receptor plug domain-containing protein [Pleomorphovibrio marinus]|uniref:TonB-dependent receptor plug domain-containing protein n=1 Tax=Pleomorphovibrio marinus TaxID=2164132 RepID=UPI000E0B84D6|nr:Plug domain-containing protein [Pleomorphovibrio marinus]
MKSSLPGRQSGMMKMKHGGMPPDSYWMGQAMWQIKRKYKHMNLIKKYSSLLWVIPLVGLLGMLPFSDELAEKIRVTLNAYRVNLAPEKVYVHHDKPHYLRGEMIWLKGYVVESSNLIPTKKSGVLYVDLLDNAGTHVKSLTLPIMDGEAVGDILLPDDLDPGVYRISAFTNWMRNFGEEHFFQKEILVLGEDRSSEEPTLDGEATVDLQFFPEGGDLVDGITSNVAFKALGNNGYGVPVEGTVFDAKGQKITDFKDFHLGMGAFELTPEVGKRYFAKVNFKDGSTLDYPLPQVLETGYVLEVDEVEDPEQIQVRVKTNSSSEQNLVLTVIAGDDLKQAEEVQAKPDTPEVFNLQKSEFPSGILRLNLGTAEGEPLAERLVFIRESKPNALKVGSDKDNYETREKVTLEVDFDKEEDEDFRFSVSVTADEWVGRKQNEENIMTYLLLSSDLKGHIEQPAYYFDNQDPERQRALRYLMMTQGWSKYQWEAIAAQKLPNIQYPNEYDLNIWGALRKPNGQPIEKGEALLFLKDRFQTFITTPVDEEGRFRFRGFYFKDSIDVMVQGTDARGRTSNVEVHMAYRDFFPFQPQPKVSLPAEFGKMVPEGYALSGQQYTQPFDADVGAMELGEILLEEVVVEGRADIHEPFRLHRQADVTLERRQLPVAPSGNIMEALQGRVAGLQVTQSGFNEFRAVIRGQGTPLYLLDGMPIDERTVSSINQFDIARVEVLKSPGNIGIYGGRGGGGVIALFTERGAAIQEEPEPGKHLVTHKATGYTKTKRFYAPKYESPESDYYDLPDLRSTVYWNPNMMVTDEGKARITFYTSDAVGDYKVILEGVSSEGRPQYASHTFSVSGAPEMMEMGSAE